MNTMPPVVGAAALLSLLCDLPAQQPDAWAEARRNAAQSQRAIRFVRSYAAGWLAQADPVSGLLPRTTKGDAYWNAKDCAADNLPFLLLTARVTGDHHLIRAADHILAQERELTMRVDSLPDDYVFGTGALRQREPRIEELIFGASEYAKDGLLPLVEWLGDGPWVARMTELVNDVWRHAPVETPDGRIPSTSVEVNGELMQTMSRLYWRTGEARYKEWTFRLADHHLFRQKLLDEKVLALRDHGCEVLGGLSEALVIAAHEDTGRARRYAEALAAVLDLVLAHAVDGNGMLPNALDPKTKQPIGAERSDGFGYVYDAFLTVGQVTGDERYEQAVRRALKGVANVRCADVKGMTGADGHADAIEGVLNLLQRLPEPAAARWVDEQISWVFDQQRPDGIIEGWYGDGNAARTALMYAMWKTQGLCPAPWRADMQCGAAAGGDGQLRVFLQSDHFWTGHLRFDRPRHRDHLHMPADYPRINQFPEWFTVAADKTYRIHCEGLQPELLRGSELHAYEFRVEAGKPARLTIGPAPAEALALRTLRYTTRGPDGARAWEHDVRRRLLALLNLADRKADLPLAPVERSRKRLDGYDLLEIELQSTPKTRIPAWVTLPHADGRHPAVVCVHGHGGTRESVHAPGLYRGFAAQLARRGYVTIAVDVGQHQVREPGRMLMEERLLDLLRCVDYLETHPVVDKDRIGCGGLSLGGEMCMWLGAVDPRVKATVSSGFLTTMEQMEKGHCMCWKFAGLRELVDYADIYALVAPRALQCQNGLREGMRSFQVPLARRAMRQIAPAFRDRDASDNLELLVHGEGHVIALPALLRFFDQHLGGGGGGQDYAVDSERRLEFIHAKVNQVESGSDGLVYIGLGPWARYFVIDPQASPDARALAAYARKAMQDGKPVYATIRTGDAVPKNAPPAVIAKARPAIVLRLAPTPDPKAPK